MPVLFTIFKSSWSSGVLACLSRKRSSVQIRSGTLINQHGAVRKLEKRRISNVRDFEGSTPSLATDMQTAKWWNW